MRRRQIIAMALCLVIASPTLYIVLHTRFSLFPSLSYRFFWISYDRTAIKKARTGDYVIFKEYVPAPVDRESDLIKRIGCMSGDQLTVDGHDDYFCNGTYLGRANSHTGAAFRFNGTVPPERLFMIGDNPASYDSRYFGFVDRSRIKSRAWPVRKIISDFIGGQDAGH